MPTADSQLILACVVVYLASCAAVGMWAMRRTSSSADFFLAGKSLGPLVVVMATISSVMSGFGFVGGPGLVYDSGISSLWMVFVSTFSLPVVFMLTGKRLRLLVEVRPILTLPEAISARYGGRWPAIAMSGAIVLGVLGYLGTQILAIGTVLQAVLGIDLVLALVIGLGVLAFYSIAGGIVAGVYTDLFQGILMLGASLAVLFQCLKVGGGMSAITGTLWAMNPDYIGPWGTRGDMAAMSWLLLFGIGAAGQPHAVTKLMMLRDIRQLKWSALATGLSYMVLAMLWMGIGLAMRTLVVRGDHPALDNPDLAAPTFLLHYTSGAARGNCLRRTARGDHVHGRFLSEPRGRSRSPRHPYRDARQAPAPRTAVVPGGDRHAPAALRCLRAVHGEPDSPTGYIRLGHFRGGDRAERLHRNELEAGDRYGLRGVNCYQRGAEFRPGGLCPSRLSTIASGAGCRGGSAARFDCGLRVGLARNQAPRTCARHRCAAGRMNERPG